MVGLETKYYEEIPSIMKEEPSANSKITLKSTLLFYRPEGLKIPMQKLETDQVNHSNNHPHSKW